MAWPSGVEGAPRWAGNIIWASDKRAIANTQSQGKGGPKVQGTTYTYEIDVMYGMADQECAGLRRVWVNGALAWSVGDDADTPTLIVSGGIFVDIANKFIEGGANKYWRAIRFYGGTADQMPDPTYEAAVGVGNAPAYRGRTTIVVEGLNLGDSGQLPVLTFEITSQGEAEHGVILQASIDQSVFGFAPFTIGTSAMSMNGYDVLAGVPDAGDGGFVNYNVVHVAADGTVSQTGNFPAEPLTGNAYGYGGSTDESLLFCSSGFTGVGPVPNMIVYFADGSFVTLDADGQGYAGWCMSKLGSLMLLVPTGTGDQKPRIYSREGGALITRAPASTAISLIGCALSSEFAYALPSDVSGVYQFDVATLTLHTDDSVCQRLDASVPDRL